MDEVTTAQTVTFGDFLRMQISLWTVYVLRPVVWRQIMAIGVIAAVSWALSSAVDRWWAGQPADGDGPRWRRWLRGLAPVVSPVVGLFVLEAVIWWFGRQGYPSGLIGKFGVLLGVWLGYRLILMVLQARAQTSVQTLRRLVLIPALALFAYVQLSRGSVGFGALMALPLGSVGAVTITLGGVVGSLATLYVFAVAAWLTQEGMLRYLPQRLNTEPGVIQSVATLTRYAILAMGILVALAVVGFDASSLALVAGGLSVGIGIGLQEIVANFVSGLTLLFEQSLRPGDVIELQGRVNRVEKVNLRATRVRTLDNVEVIIPNAQFTTNQVTTLTGSDNNVRVGLPFGVSYDSDPQQVGAVAVATARRHGLVLQRPEPMLLFRGFGESSLDFELSVWLNEPERRERVRSDLHYMLFAALREAGIEIPYPQRDLNLRRGWEQLALDAQPD